MSDTEEGEIVSRLNSLFISIPNIINNLSVSTIPTNRPTMNPPNPPTINPTHSPSSIFSENQLQEMKKIITETISSILHPDTAVHNVEENIDFSENVSDSERIPDIVKTLREFSGKPGEFNSWRKAVDRILTVYAKYRGTPKYYSILHAIRHKIVGEADTALESYRTPLDWPSIKKCLVLHYSDKRDISTLEYQMTVLAQRHLSITEFYQQVYHHLSLILDKIDCLELGEEALSVLTKSYRDKALDTFIRGLKGELPSLLSVTNPTSLPQALHTCLKLGNLGVRIRHADDKGPGNPKPLQPVRNRPFYPELTHESKNFEMRNSYQNRQFYNRPTVPHGPAVAPKQVSAVANFGNARPPLPPKPQIPMDVDRSLQTRQINYQNRPQKFDENRWQNKRQLSANTHQPQKYPRVFNTEANVHQDLDLNDYPDQEDHEIEVEYEEESEVYKDDLDFEKVDDINFLD